MNFISAFVTDMRNSYFSHSGWNSARGWCVGRKKNPLWKVGNFSKLLFFVCCHAIKLKVNGLNRLKAKNLPENLYHLAVYFCSTVGSVVILFPRPAERPNVSASGKGPLSVINYLLTLSACRKPIYLGFLLPQAQDNLFFCGALFLFMHLFNDNSFGVETVRNYPTWTWKYSPQLNMN